MNHPLNHPHCAQWHSHILPQIDFHSLLYSIHGPSCTENSLGQLEQLERNSLCALLPTNPSSNLVDSPDDTPLFSTNYHSSHLHPPSDPWWKTHTHPKASSEASDLIILFSNTLVGRSHHPISRFPPPPPSGPQGKQTAPTECLDIHAF